MTADLTCNRLYCVARQRWSGENSPRLKGLIHAAGLRRFLPSPQSYGKIRGAWDTSDGIKEMPLLIAFTGVSVGGAVLHGSQGRVSQCFRRLNNEYCSAGTAFNV